MAEGGLAEHLVPDLHRGGVVGLQNLWILLGQIESLGGGTENQVEGPLLVLVGGRQGPGGVRLAGGRRGVGVGEDGEQLPRLDRVPDGDDDRLHPGRPLRDDRVLHLHRLEDDDLAARGIALSLGGSVYDPTDPMGKMFFNILATFAEFEVDLLRMRTREGMKIARAKGKLRGKKPKLSEKQHRELRRMYDTGDYSISDLADVFAVSRPTIYRTLQRTESAN